MAAADNDTELLTEHFGYPPVSLIDEIINSINILADKALTSVETGLLNAPPTSLGFGRPNPLSNTTSSNANSRSKRKRKQPEPPPADDPDDAEPLTPEQIEEQARAEIAAGTHQLETLLCTSIDRNFDKFELYVMRNILCVRPEDRDWIRLGHYEGLNFDNLPASALQTTRGHTSDDDGRMDIDDADVQRDDDENNPDTPTIASVERLRRRLQASQRLSTMLTAERARNDTLLRELRAIAGRNTAAAAKEDEPEPPLAFLHNKGDLAQADAATPLTTTTAFALSQMQALRALSASLSGLMPDLKGPAASAGEDSVGGDAAVVDATRRTWRKERVEYVEGAARRHLETIRGLELGRNGEVRDGEWQGDGARLGVGEVGALEGVVQRLSREDQGGGDEDNGAEEMEEDDDGVE